MTSHFGTLYSSGPARVLVCGPFNSSAAVQLVLVEKDLCCSMSLETCEREQHIICNHMMDKRTISNMTALAIDVPGAEGGGGTDTTFW